jgi:hypothetical protein
MARRNTEVLSISADPEDKARVDAARGYMSRSAFLISAALRRCEEIEAQNKRNERQRKDARAA